MIQRIANYTYNVVNQLTGQSGFEGTKTFTYDLAGNMTGDGTRKWDAENHPAKIVQGPPNRESNAVRKTIRQPKKIYSKENILFRKLHPESPDRCQTNPSPSVQRPFARPLHVTDGCDTYLLFRRQ